MCFSSFSRTCKLFLLVLAVDPLCRKTYKSHWIQRSDLSIFEVLTMRYTMGVYFDHFAAVLLSKIKLRR